MQHYSFTSSSLHGRISHADMLLLHFYVVLLSSLSSSMIKSLDVHFLRMEEVLLFSATKSRLINSTVISCRILPTKPLGFFPSRCHACIHYLLVASACMIKSFQLGMEKCGIKQASSIAIRPCLANEKMILSACNR
jgi:hypothetical protein